MFCTHCGGNNAEGYVFCMHCGRPLPQARPIPEEILPAPAPQPELPPDLSGGAVLPEPPDSAPGAEEVLPDFRLPQDIAELPEPPRAEAAAQRSRPAAIRTQSEWTPGQAPEVLPEPEPVPEPAPAPQPEPTAPSLPPQPPRPAPEQPPRAQPKPRPKARPKAGAGAKVASVFLCIFLCLFLLAACCVGLGRHVLSGDTLERLLEDFDPDEITLEVDGREMGLVDCIYENLDPSVQEYLSRRSIRRLISDEEVQEQIAELYGRYTAYFTQGGRMREITAEDLVDLIRDNEDLIYRETGYQLDEQAYRELEIALDRQVNFSALSQESLDDFMGGNLDVLQLLLSRMFYVILLALAALMAVLVLLAHYRHLSCAVTPLCVSGLTLGLLLLALGGGSLFLGRLLDGSNLGLLAPFYAAIPHYFLLRGAVLSLLTALLLIGRKLLRRRAARAAS